MYRYDEFDAAFVADRLNQFSDQVARRLSGELTEEQFRIHRLMNGVYLQLHAYMLRIAIPYGTLSSRQMRKLAHIARRYDKGFGHFTTRQNIQFNWPALKDIPEILGELASVEMHAIQTSGNCIRNVTADHFAGAAADEIEDPRPYAEILRQWSSIHPEFTYLPRKFKLALSGSPHDRAATQVHDIGYQLVKNGQGETGFAVYVGGGLGRTPMVGHKIRDFLPVKDLLAYTQAIVRVYNLEGRRDNKYKARIKILVHEKGFEPMREAVEAEFAADKSDLLALPWPLMSLCFTVTGFGFMMLHNSVQAEVAELAPAARASAFSLHSCSFFLGQAIGPIIYGFGVHQVGQGWLVLNMALLAATGIVTSRLFARHPSASGRQ
jgi:sulfite reductase (NADPH) hemoprotein beta-component